MDHNDDHEFFRRSMQDVTPLAPDNRALLPPAPRRPKHQPTRTRQPVQIGLADYLQGEVAVEFLRNGLSSMALRKLRRGQFPPQDTLDLHGLTLDAARDLLISFLDHAARRQLRCVCVIHGKGRTADGSDGPLKRNTRHWLSQHPQVLAYCEPAAMYGGGGAVWILLRR